MRIEEVPPHAASLMEATRSIGYSVEAAVADIVDNSIAAGATVVSIHFFPIGDPYLSILDNGIGMDEEQLINAMRYGAGNPTHVRATHDLGRFGLGLKTASLSQCRRLTVISKKGDVLAGAQWDLDYVAATGYWSLKILESRDFADYPQMAKLHEFTTGTLVVWQVLDRMKAGEANFESAMARIMDGVRHHLGLVFHRYLSGEAGLTKLRLSLNGVPLEPVDPFLLGKSTQVMDDETITIEGHDIVVSPFVLPHVSRLTTQELEMLGGDEGLRRQQGFYIYRNKRLLTWGTWFRMIRQDDLSKLARIRVDIPNALDHLWTLDIKKSRATPPQSVKDSLRSVILRVAELSKRTYTYRGKRETSSPVIHPWTRLRTRDGGIVYEVNRDHPLVLAVQSQLDGRGRTALEQMLRHIEKGLPLNALYVDLTSDKKVVNETEWSENELIDTLQHLLSTCKTEEDREALHIQLMRLDPFNEYPHLLARIFGEVV